MTSPASMPFSDITIAIASIGRPSLLAALDSLDRIHCPDDTRVTVLVADDSRDGAARRLVESRRDPRWPVRCLPVASGNIATARNALLDAATGDWIAWIDDDEHVEPEWLVRMMACAADFNADVVIGPVLPTYPDSAPDWMVAARPHYNHWGHRGKRLFTGRGGNTLMRRRVTETHGLRFDPALGRTGGEDTDLFSRAAAQGAVIVATDDAIVHEPVPPERLAPSYILRRAVRAGQSFGLTRLGEQPGLAARLAYGSGVTAKCLTAGVLAILLWPVNRGRSFRMRQKLALNFGKIRAVFGLPLAELYVSS
ncbi:hypothetical protein CSC94_20620 [Zhengella mangrovi]|uniref:Glycosyltransferase 2-like domain-containing protein n=1 Tax=Zhengella mangrovi TaxID=1982044 RepID=A0A2G1QHY4_9HYPH|nr:glycosyltransferase family 2 protein [Zhengella mangrovi]PHP65126.1 hypothetical protein CSC94_20620 [Zhengella mangrovi]